MTGSVIAETFVAIKKCANNEDYERRCIDKILIFSFQNILVPALAFG